MKPKILIFSGYFYPHKGGSEEFMLSLSKFLSKNGFDCSVITCNTENAPEIEKIGKITVYRVNSWHFVGKKYPVPKPGEMISLLKKLSKKKKFDYIFTNTRFFNICAYAPFFKKYSNPKAKIIHIEHGTKHTDNESLLVYWVNYLYDYTLGRFVVRSADSIFGISDKSRKFVHKISGKKSGILRNCIDVSAFEKKSNPEEIKAIKRKLGIKNEFVVSYAGRLIEAKGVQDIIKACHDLKVVLVILGSGDYEKQLKKQAKNMNNAVFISKVYSRKDLINILSVTDVFVNASYNEGLPTSVLEAGAAGVPVMATDVGGTNEIIENNKNGFLVKPGNVSGLKKSIKKLMNDINLREIFAKSLKQKIVREFDCKKAFTPILKVLEHKSKNRKRKNQQKK